MDRRQRASNWIKHGLNFADGDSGLAAFYVVMGIGVLAVSLITNYQYSPKREWSGASQTA